jgi:hypothetical protein
MDAELMREKMDAHRSAAIDSMRDNQEINDSMVRMMFEVLEGSMSYERLEMKLEALIDHEAETLIETACDDDPWEAA